MRTGPRLTFWIASAALVLLTFAAYSPAVRNGFIWDDDAYVTDNPALRSAAGLDQIWTDPAAVPLPQYYPVTFTTFWVEHHLWGGRPAGYHVDNVLLQAVNAVLLWLLLKRLDIPGAWFAAAVFAVHPVGVESVAWITERKNVLSTAFYLGAFLIYPLQAGSEVLRRAGSAAQNTRVLARRLRYFAAFCLFLPALFSKTVTASLPAAILLVVYWQTGRVRPGDVLRLIPFFVAGIVMGTVTSDWERVHVGATGPEWSSITFADRILISGRAVWFYFGKIIWPNPLSFIYPRWSIDAGQLWQWTFPVGVAAVIAGLFALRKKIGRGPLVAALFYVGTLFPALGFADVYPMRYSFVADHFQYLAMIGVVAAAAAVVSRVNPGPKRFTQASILVAFTTITAYRCLAYRDSLTLWTDTASKNPGSWMVHSHLGNIAERSHRFDTAFAEYMIAARLGSSVPDPHVDAARALGHLGKFEQSEAECRDALAIDPGWAPAYDVLSKLLLRKGQIRAAAAASLDADGYRLLRSMDTQNAKAKFAAALRADPSDSGAKRGLALSEVSP
jgi:Flp pilus assembly protein TadD